MSATTIIAWDMNQNYLTFFFLPHPHTRLLFNPVREPELNPDEVAFEDAHMHVVILSAAAMPSR
jgi:hypothetical protein